MWLVLVQAISAVGSTQAGKAAEVHDVARYYLLKGRHSVGRPPKGGAAGADILGPPTDNTVSKLHVYLHCDTEGLRLEGERAAATISIAY